MKTKDKEITQLETAINELHKSNDISKAAYSTLKFALHQLKEQKANEKELLKKCFEAGGKHELKPLTTVYEQCPDFETWYNQLKNQKENG